MAGWFPLFSLSGFNGGKSQVNPNFLQIGGDYAFLNVLKTAQFWGFQDNTSAPVTPDLLDSNGYPTSIVHGGVKTVCYVPTQASRSGNYVATWTGNGTIAFGMSNTLVSGSKTGSSGVGRYVFSTTDNRFDVQITATPVTDLKIYHINDEPDILAGKVFGAKFKARLAEANFGVLRFLNWQNGNGTNETTWATRKPISYAMYGAYHLIPTFYCATSTSLTGTQYSVTGPSGFSLADKTTIHMLFAQSYTSKNATFTNGSASIGVMAHGLSINARVRVDTDPNNGSTPPTNFSANVTYFVVSVPDADHITISATQGGTAIIAGSAAGGSGLIQISAFLTLNVSSSGNIDIVDAYSNPLSWGGNSYPIAGTDESLATLMYDATLNAWIKQGGDLASRAAGLTSGVPPELLLQLCTEVGAHPYFVTPGFAIDPATDYMPSLAAYCKANQPSWMIPRYEGCNELWNNAFFFTNYATNKAIKYGWANTFHDWMGKTMSVLGQIVSQIYGNDRTKYQVLCGVQTSQGDTSGDRANSLPRFTSAAYLGTTPQSPITGSFGTITISATSGVADAKLWITTLNCAQYITPSDYGQSAETTLAAAFAGGDNTAPGTYVDTLNSGSGAFTLSNLAIIYAGWKSFAQSVGIQRMCGYEGGYSPDYNSGGNSDVDRLRAAGKLVSQLQTYTTTNYNNFVGQTGTGFVAEFPSCFQLSGNINITGYSQDAWSVLEDIYQTNPPQWTAIVAFNH